MRFLGECGYPAPRVEGLSADEGPTIVGHSREGPLDCRTACAYKRCRISCRSPMTRKYNLRVIRCTTSWLGQMRTSRPTYFTC
jgi:hypothetical protein